MVEDFRRAYVSCVNDVVRSAQGVYGFGTKQAVSVGDDAEVEGSSQFSVLGSQCSESGFISAFISECGGAPSIDE